MDKEKWLKYRKLSFVNFCLTNFTFGLLLSIKMPTEYFYFKDTMKLKSPEIYYGLSVAVFSVSGFIFSFVGSMLYDATHQVRHMYLVADTVIIVGHIMHAFYFHPAFVITGQFLVGMGAAREVSGMAELARIYDENELTTKVSMISLFWVIGNMIGPCLTFLFVMVDTRIGNWRLHVNNMSDIVMGSLYLANFMLNVFTLKDLSKDRVMRTGAKDIQIEEDNEKTMMIKDEEMTTLSLKKQYLIGIRALFTNPLVILVFMSILCETLTFTWETMLTPVMGNVYLHWTQIQAATCSVVALLIGAIMSSTVVMLTSKYITDIDFILYSLLAFTSGLIFFLFFPHLTDKTGMTSFIYAGVILMSSASVVNQIAVRSMLAKMVPVSLQGMTEGFRNAFQEIAAVIAGFSFVFPSHHMEIALSSLVILCVVQFIWFLSKREQYHELKINVSI